MIEADSPSVVVYGGADMPLTGPIPEGAGPLLSPLRSTLFGDVFAAFQE